jgi:hypothetical protein
LNILSGSAKDELARLLKQRGYQILGKNQRELVETRIDGRVTMGELVAEYTVAKNGKRYVVWGVRGESEADPTAPALRDKLIALDRAFGLSGIILANLAKNEVQVISFRYPRERGIDFYFQFLSALLVLAGVIGIIWLMVAVKLF